MLITNGTIVQSGMRRRTIQRQVNFGPVTMRVVTIVVFAAAALIVLAQSTTSSTKAYAVNALEQTRDAKEQEKQNLEVEMTRLQALGTLTTEQGTTSPTPTPSAPALESSKEINFIPASTNANLSQLPTDTQVE